MLEQRIGLIGAGQMARAWGRGVLEAGLVAADRIIAFDPLEQAAEQFAAEVPGSRIAADNSAVVQSADVVVIAVKPQNVPAVMAELAGVVSGDKLVVSIAAGVPLARLCSGLETDRVIRVMPNTPCLVGRGAAAYALGPGADEADGQLVGQLLEAVGVAYQLPESLLDAVTGLSGSGPAFVYTIIEALADGGVRMGLPRPVAVSLAAQTVRGAAEMVQHTGEHTGVLRDRVTSPAGTTIVGLQVMESQAVRGALISAVQAAAERSRELGKS
jgi:pyrroline-5-carboxylate reductase